MIASRTIRKECRHTSDVHNFLDKPGLYLRVIIHGILVVARGFFQLNRREENPRLGIAIFDVRIVPVYFASILQRFHYENRNMGERPVTIRSWSI